MRFFSFFKLCFFTKSLTFFYSCFFSYLIPFFKSCFIWFHNTKNPFVPWNCSFIYSVSSNSFICQFKTPCYHLLNPISFPKFPLIIINYINYFHFWFQIFFQQTFNPSFFMRCSRFSTFIQMFVKSFFYICCLTNISNLFSYWVNQYVYIYSFHIYKYSKILFPHQI